MQTGRVVANRYRLEEKIGSGSGGVVWRATDERLGREVALKRALAGEGDPQRFQQLEREAKLLARLNHRHVVTIYTPPRHSLPTVRVDSLAELPGRIAAPNAEAH